MEILEHVLLVLHFLGLAALIGGFLVQIKASTRVVNNAMFHGALTQLVTGILLVGIAYPLADGDEAQYPDNAKIAVKLLILLVIIGLILANRKKEAISTAVWGAIGGLAILNVVIAVFW
jgi:hypothetical protein